LDPRSRQELWSIIDEIRSEGTTVLLTTQYLDEADRLAQQIALVDHGRIVAQGTAAQLKARIGGSVLSVRLVDAAQLPLAAATLTTLTAADEPRVDAVDGEIRLAVADPAATTEAVRRLDARHLAIASIELQQPSLDDVFLTLIGRPAAEDPIQHRVVKEAA
jgi:ABC-2 type transport system ATP-binding protein